MALNPEDKAVLGEAAATLSKGGAWLQGAMSGTEGGLTYLFTVADDAVCFCAMGAIGKAAGLREYVAIERHPATKAFAAAVGEAVTMWNDALDRTQDEVVDMLRKVAA